MHQLVVARYAEDLDWLAEVPPEFEVHVYNKGAPVTSRAAIARAATIVDRPNEGRESETYLTHVGKIQAEAQGAQDQSFVVFAQGDPFEHSPDFLALLKTWPSWQPLQSLSWRWRANRNIPPAEVLTRETGGFIDGLRVRPELFSLQSWTPLGFQDPGTFWLQKTYLDIHGLPGGSNIAAHFLAMCELPGLAAAANSHLLGRFAYGALFAARRSQLMGLSGESLAALRRAALSHEVYGYVLERMWLHLFGQDFILRSLAPDTIGSLPLMKGAAFIAPDRTSARMKRLKKLSRVSRRVMREARALLGTAR